MQLNTNMVVKRATHRSRQLVIIRTLKSELPSMINMRRRGTFRKRARRQRIPGSGIKTNGSRSSLVSWLMERKPNLLLKRVSAHLVQGGFEVVEDYCVAEAFEDER